MTQITTKTKGENRLDFVAIDAGNRFIKFFDRRGNPHKIPSYTKELEDYQDDLIPDRHSVIVELDGSKYAIGQIAKELNGSPSFLQNKSQLAPLLVLPAIEQIEGSQLPLVIDRLILTLPDSRNKENREFLKGLEGTKTVIRNGIEFTYTINKVLAIDECLSAYKFAVGGGLYQTQAQTNGILDCGGGTALGKLFTPSGNIIREADLVLPGTNDLARAIAMRLTPKIGYSPSLDLILDGIESNHFLLGTTGVDFKAEFLAAHEQWQEKIRQLIRATWQPFYSQIAEVLIVGGSAPLLKSFEAKTNGRFKVVPDHQFMSVKGLTAIGKEG